MIFLVTTEEVKPAPLATVPPPRPKINRSMRQCTRVLLRPTLRPPAATTPRLKHSPVALGAILNVLKRSPVALKPISGPLKPTSAPPQPSPRVFLQRGLLFPRTFLRAPSTKLLSPPPCHIGKIRHTHVYKGRPLRDSLGLSGSCQIRFRNLSLEIWFLMVDRY